MDNKLLAKILLGLFFFFAYVFAVRIVYVGYKHPGNWTHNTRHYPYGRAIVVVLLLPQFGLLLLADNTLSGSLRTIVLSLLGAAILTTTTALLLDFVGKKQLFKNDR